MYEGWKGKEVNFLKLLACLFPFHWIKNDSFDNIGFTPLDESQKAKIEKSWGISFTVSIWQTISSKSYSRLLSLASFGDASSIISGLPYFVSRLQSKYFFARNLNTSLIFALVTPSFGKHGGAVGESVEFLVCNVLFCLLCFLSSECSLKKFLTLSSAVFWKSFCLVSEIFFWDIIKKIIDCSSESVLLQCLIFTYALCLIINSLKYKWQYSKCCSTKSIR